MTAVLSFTERSSEDPNFGCPMMFGDLLVSSTTDRTDLHIPTIGPVREIFPDGSGFVPVDLAQKLVLIGAHFAAGWSGPAIAVRSLFRALFEADQAGSLTEELLRNELAELNKSKIGRDLTCIIAIHRSQTQLFFVTNGAHYEVPPFEQVVALGSGADALVNTLRRSIGNMGQLLASSGRGIYAQHRLARLISSLFHEEVTTNQSVLNYYGGGYEAIFRTSEGFRKVDKSLHAFFRASVTDGQADLHYPHRIIYQRYLDDVLLINSYRLGDVTNHAEEAVGIAHENYTLAVPPVYRDITRDEHGALQAAAKEISQDWLFVHLQAYSESSGRSRLYSIVSSMSDTNKRVQLIPTANGLEAVVREDLVKQLRDAAARELRALC